jgi:hypothetical protein
MRAALYYPAKALLHTIGSMHLAMGQGILHNPNRYVGLSISVLVGTGSNNDPCQHG